MSRVSESVPAGRRKMLRVDGDELAYTTSGSGPAVLLIQGVGVIGDGWRPQVEGLAEGFTLFTPDNRGVGASTLGPEPLTIERMAADALAVMDAEQVDRFHVIGHSMGGLIAQHVAFTARARVQSLSLLCTFADGKEGSRMSPGMMFRALRARIGTRTMRRDGMLRLIFPEAYLRTMDRERLAEDLALLFGRDLADQPPILMKQLRAMARYSATSRLAQLAALPTLVVSAVHDPIAPPRLGRALAAAIDGGRFIEFPHAGHALPIQCAGEVNALLIEHLLAAEQAGLVPTLIPDPRSLIPLTADETKGRRTRFPFCNRDPLGG